MNLDNFGLFTLQYGEPAMRFRGNIRAPEFPSGLTWINSDQPLQLKELLGKVVILEFWTYC